MSQLLGGGGADLKGLEGRPQGEKEGERDGRIKPREFNSSIHLILSHWSHSH